MRLDQWLTQNYPKISRSAWQRRIKAGEVLVNGAPPKSVHVTVAPTDEVKVVKASKRKTSVVKNTPVAPTLIPRVVEETDDFIVLEKPAGMVMHRASSHRETDTLADWVVDKYPKVKKIGDDALRPGIVHRLDREVSGLVVVARTPEMFANLKEQFQAHAISKIYTALVHGVVAKESDLIAFPLTRSKSGKIAARPVGSEGREAQTRYTVAQRYLHFTLLGVEILTGRTHQIRAHMAAINHPLVGDPLYHPRKFAIDRSLDRIFLHASELAFSDVAGKEHRYTSALPKELKEYLKGLKR